MTRCRRNRGKTGQAAGLTPSRRSTPGCQMARWPFRSEIVVDGGPSGGKVGLGDAKKEIPGTISGASSTVAGDGLILASSIFYGSTLTALTSTEVFSED